MASQSQIILKLKDQASKKIQNVTDESKELDSALDKIDKNPAIKNLERQADDAWEALDRMGSGMRGAGGVLTGMVTAPILAAFGALVAIAQDGTEEGEAMQAAFANLKEETEELGKQFVEIIVPVITDVINKVTELVEWFQTLSDGQRRLIVIVAAVAAAIGPLLLTWGNMVDVVVQLRNAFIGLRTVMATSVLPALAPFLPLIIAIGAAVALFAVAYKQNWLGIGDATRAAIDWIRTQFDRFGDFAKAVIGNLENIQMFFGVVFRSIGTIVSEFAETFIAVWNYPFLNAELTLQRFNNTVREKFVGMLNAVIGQMNRFLQLATQNTVGKWLFGDGGLEIQPIEFSPETFAELENAVADQEDRIGRFRETVTREWDTVSGAAFTLRDNIQTSMEESAAAQDEANESAGEYKKTISEIDAPTVDLKTSTDNLSGSLDALATSYGLATEAAEDYIAASQTAREENAENWVDKLLRLVSAGELDPTVALRELDSALEGVREDYAEMLAFPDVHSSPANVQRIEHLEQLISTLEGGQSELQDIVGETNSTLLEQTSIQRDLWQQEVERSNSQKEAGRARIAQLQEELDLLRQRNQVESPETRIANAPRLSSPGFVDPSDTSIQDEARRIAEDTAKAMFPAIEEEWLALQGKYNARIDIPVPNITASVPSSVDIPTPNVSASVPDAISVVPNVSSAIRSDLESISFQRINDELQSQIEIATDLEAVFGDTFNLGEEKTRLVEDAITSLIEQGFEPTSEAVLLLKSQLDGIEPDEIEGLEVAVGRVQEAFNEIYGAVIDVFTALGAPDNVIEGLNKIGEAAGSVMDGLGALAKGNIVGAIAAGIKAVVSLVQGIIAWFTPAWVKVAREIEKSMKSGVVGGISSALQSYISGESTLSEFKENLKQNIYAAVLDGIIQAIVQKGIIEGALSDTLKGISEAAAKGDWSQVNELVKGINVRGIVDEATKAAGVVRDTFSGVLQDAEEVQAETQEAQSYGQFISQAISIPFYDATLRFDSSVTRFGNWVDSLPERISVSTAVTRAASTLPPAY